MVDKTQFKQRLKTARKAAGFSQESFAKALDVATHTVQNWEAGRREPDIATLKKISLTLKVNPGFLFGDERTDPQTDFTLAASFLSKFAGLPRDLQKIVMALVFEDDSYAEGVSDLYLSQVLQRIELPRKASE